MDIDLNQVNEAEMERGLSIEMISKKHVKSLIIGDETRDRVLIDVDIGKLLQLTFVDGRVLEIKGAYGTLRVDVTEEEMKKMLIRVSPCEHQSD